MAQVVCAATDWKRRIASPEEQLAGQRVNDKFQPDDKPCARNVHRRFPSPDSAASSVVEQKLRERMKRLPSTQRVRLSSNIDLRQMHISQFGSIVTSP